MMTFKTTSNLSFEWWHWKQHSTFHVLWFHLSWQSWNYPIAKMEHCSKFVNTQWVFPREGWDFEKVT
jgi:hypothetical protein